MLRTEVLLQVRLAERQISFLSLEEACLQLEEAGVNFASYLEVILYDIKDSSEYIFFARTPDSIDIFGIRKNGSIINIFKPAILSRVSYQLTALDHKSYGTTDKLAIGKRIARLFQFPEVEMGEREKTAIRLVEGLPDEAEEKFIRRPLEYITD